MQVCDLEKQMVGTKGNSERIVAEYENAMIELEKLYDYVTNGKYSDQRHSGMKQRRKIPNIFLSRKTNKAKSHIRKVIDSNGEEITD